MARKKKDGPGKGGIIQLNPGKQDNETIWDGDWDEDDDWDEEDDSWENEMAEELISALMNRLVSSNEGGMTDMQFKSMLMDQRETWKRVQQIAKEEKAEKTIQAIQDQIRLINMKLKA